MRNNSGVQFAEHLPESHPLRPNQHGEVQMPMFMSAHEILQSHHPLAGDRRSREDALDEQGGSESTQTPYGWDEEQEHESDQQLWDRKYEEAHSQGLAEHISEHGVQSAIQLGTTRQSHPDNPNIMKPEIVGGHHRVAVMAEEHKHNLMPVLFYSGSEVKPGSRNQFGMQSPSTDIGAARSNKAYPYEQEVEGYESDH